MSRHCPSRQAWVRVSQALPQAPQFALSNLRFVQDPPQHSRPVAPHEWLHLPQWFWSVRVSTH
jgi:hypothetical protein